MNIYESIVQDIEGQDVSLAKYKGKVLLIVNSATHCGLTPQYEGLQQLHRQFEGKDFAILDFPCNQFLEQSPEDNAGIKGFCALNYGVEYDQFAKVDVNGEHAHPLFKHLKSEKAEDRTNAATAAFMSELESIGEGRTGSDIRWNFTKFLLDKDGRVVERYSPTVLPEEIVPDIERLLSL